MLPEGGSTETPPLLLPPTVGQALWLSPQLYPNLHIWKDGRKCEQMKKKEREEINEEGLKGGRSRGAANMRA